MTFKDEGAYSVTLTGGGGLDFTNTLKLQAASNSAGGITWTLPASNGSTGNVLSNDGAGTLSWVANSAGTLSLTTLPPNVMSPVFIDMGGGVVSESVDFQFGQMGSLALVQIGASMTRNSVIQFFNPANSFSIMLWAHRPSADRIYSMPDIGADADFVMTEGTQNPINGNKAFTGSTTFADITTGSPSVMGAHVDFNSTITVYDTANLTNFTLGNSVATVVSNATTLASGHGYYTIPSNGGVAIAVTPPTGATGLVIYVENQDSANTTGLVVHALSTQHFVYNGSAWKLVS